MQASDRALAAREQRASEPPRRGLAWVAAVWLAVIVALSATASVRPRLLLQWTQYLPGRDKTGHFLLMGGFAAVSVLAFAGRRLGTRRVPAVAVLAAAALIVVVEEAVQRWLPHRTLSGVDLAWSLAGVACFGGLAAIASARRARRGPSKR